jgi:ubiquinone/menaquinone biosynthesis C-methylase UbiE
MFGLMFFPDRSRGLSEMFRVLKPGAQVVIGAWASVTRSPLMICLFDALRFMDPSMKTPADDIDSYENPEVLKRELTTAGFEDARVEAVERSMRIEDVEEFWTSMCEGSAPLVLMKKRLGDAEWNKKQLEVLAHLRANLTLPVELGSIANIGIARKPA